MHNLIRPTGLSGPVDMRTPYDPDSLAGKTVLITGGANGLGAAFARRWAAHGANLFIGDVADAAGEALVAELRAAYPDAYHAYAHCDVTIWEDQVALFAAAASLAAPRGGGIDVVVANAGVLDLANSRPFEDPKPAGDGRGPAKPSTAVLEINSLGLAYTAHLAMYWLPRNSTSSSESESESAVAANDKPQDQDRDRCLLLMGSIAGIIPLPGQAQYCMSKHGVTGLFRALRGTAWLRHRVRLNLLCPYFVGGSNMVAPAVEAMFLTGGAGPASIEDTVEAATRLVADRSVVGRGLVVGPRLRPAAAAAGDASEGSGDDAVGVWDCYAEDYVETEMFVARYIRLINAIEAVRGWVGWARDLVGVVWRRK